MQKNRFLNSAIFIFMLFFCLVWIVPVVFLIFTALKSEPDLVKYSWFSPPKVIRWQNFIDAWNSGHMSAYMRNSVLLALMRVPLMILLDAFTAFALSRVGFKWGTGVFLFFLMGMMIPVQATLAPNMMLLRDLHLFNSLPGLMIVLLAFGIPFGVLMFRGFMRTLPRELDDAAVIDGCSTFRLFRSIIFPLLKPVIAVQGILGFMGTYNEFLFVQVFIRDNKWRTITTGLLKFRGEYMSTYTLLSAGILISVVPIFLIFLFFQKQIVSSLGGSIKG
jgi:raffinose/stachyose/melibiose transport system permease protein